MSRLQEDFWEQVSKPYGYERADDDKGAQTRFGGPGGGHESLGHDRLCAKELFAPDKRRKNAEGKWEVVAQGTMSRLQEDFWEQVSKPYGYERADDDKGAQTRFGGLEEDMSPWATIACAPKSCSRQTNGARMPRASGRSWPREP